MKVIICFVVVFLASSSIEYASGLPAAEDPVPKVPAVAAVVDPAHNGTAINDTTSTTLKPTIPTIKPTEAPTTNTTVKPTDVPIPTTKPTEPPKPTEPTTTTTTTTTTTPKPCPTLPPVASSTALPATAAPPKERSFDGLSFMGGMVLTVGLLAIGVVAFQYFRSRAEPKYTTM